MQMVVHWTGFQPNNGEGASKLTRLPKSPFAASRFSVKSPSSKKLGFLLQYFYERTNVCAKGASVEMQTSSLVAVRKHLRALIRDLRRTVPCLPSVEDLPRAWGADIRHEEIA